MSRKPTPSPIAELRANLDQLVAQTTSATLSAPRRRSLDKEIRGVIEELESFLNTLDPIRQPSAVFDPSNPKVVGRFVSLALVAQQRHPLAEIPRFYGSGIYAIYYNGPFPAYTVRTARKWLETAGAPLCPIPGHGAMCHEPLDEDQDDKAGG